AGPLDFPSFIFGMALSPDGKTLAVACDDSALYLCDLRREASSGRVRLRVRSTLRGHTNTIWSVAFAPDGATVVTGSWDGTAKLWATGFRRAEPAVRLTGSAGEGYIGSVAFAPDGGSLVAG